MIISIPNCVPDIEIENCVPVLLFKLDESSYQEPLDAYVDASIDKTRTKELTLTVALPLAALLQAELECRSFNRVISGKKEITCYDEEDKLYFNCIKGELIKLVAQIEAMQFVKIK